MIRNSKGEIVYTKYGSVYEYVCQHCGVILGKPPKEAIYAAAWTWYKDGAGRVRCGQCKNLAERV